MSCIINLTIKLKTSLSCETFYKTKRSYFFHSLKSPRSRNRITTSSAFSNKKITKNSLFLKETMLFEFHWKVMSWFLISISNLWYLRRHWRVYKCILWKLFNSFINFCKNYNLFRYDQDSFIFKERIKSTNYHSSVYQTPQNILNWS